MAINPNIKSPVVNYPTTNSKTKRDLNHLNKTRFIVHSFIHPFSHCTTTTNKTSLLINSSLPLKWIKQLQVTKRFNWKSLNAVCLYELKLKETFSISGGRTLKPKKTCGTTQKTHKCFPYVVRQNQDFFLPSIHSSRLSFLWNIWNTLLLPSNNFHNDDDFDACAKKKKTKRTTSYSKNTHRTALIIIAIEMRSGLKENAS